MGGVEFNEPPSKRVKQSSSSSEIAASSSLSDSMARPLADETIGSKGVNKVEFVRLIAEALHSFGYKEASKHLEKESEIPLCESVVGEFSRQILDGNWDESLNLLRRIYVLDETVVRSASFVILEQKFLELVGADEVKKALTTLRTEIAPLSINNNRLRDLSNVMLSFGQNSIKSKPRSELLKDVQNLFPPTVMIPEGRLLHLVEQALDLQREACTFHNTVIGETSLFTDHHCGRDKIPSKTLQILREHRDEVWFLQFSYNGKFLASSSSDKSAIIWEVHLDGSLSLKHRLLGHDQSVCCVSWSPEDDQLLTCGVEEVVRRWDVSSGKCLRIYEKEGFGTISCGWTPDGKRVFSGFTDKSIIMWDLDGKEMESWRGQKTQRISDLQITKDGKLIISICRETMILILDRESRAERFIREDQNIVSLVLSGDNKLLLVSLVNQEIHLWSIHGELRLVANYKGHKRSRFIIRACFGGLDQTFVASGSEDSQVYIWHRETGELIETLGGHSGAVNCIGWNPANPHMLASASDDRTIRIWGLKSMDLRQNCNGRADLHSMDES